jgi:hypothetical protein
MNNEISIWFYLDGEAFAARFSAHVPQVGDEVRFNGKIYKVVLRVWIYDEKQMRVAMNIEPITEATRH